MFDRASFCGGRVRLSRKARSVSSDVPRIRKQVPASATLATDDGHLEIGRARPDNPTASHHGSRGGLRPGAETGDDVTVPAAPAAGWNASQPLGRGGNAVRGVGESFSANPALGMATLTVPDPDLERSLGVLDPRARSCTTRGPATASSDSGGHSRLRRSSGGPTAVCDVRRRGGQRRVRADRPGRTRPALVDTGDG